MHGHWVRGRTVPAAGLLCVVGALTGCASTAATSGSSLTATSPAPVSTSTATSPTSPAPPAHPTPGQPATTPPATHPVSAAHPECRKADLSVTVGSSDAAAGHRRVVVVFTNTGTRTCSVYGYPGVAALGAGGTQVAQAARTRSGYMGGLSATHLPTVTLTVGHSASAVIEAQASNADGSACAAYQGLLVTIPDDTASTTVPWGNDGCSDLQVHPVVPGTSGDDN